MSIISQKKKLVKARLEANQNLNTIKNMHEYHINLTNVNYNESFIEIILLENRELSTTYSVNYDSFIFYLPQISLNLILNSKIYFFINSELDTASVANYHWSYDKTKLICTFVSTRVTDNPLFLTIKMIYNPLIHIYKN